MYQLIINPTAGAGRAKVVSDQAIAYLKEKNISFATVYTTAPGQATQLAREAVSKGIQTVISFGGDGTISEIAQGLHCTETALGIVPCGTGNDFIKSVQLPTDWKEAIDFILEHPARLIDTGTMNDTFFINVAGAGFDVMTLDYAEKAKKHVRGIWPYLYGVICSIFKFKPYHMKLQIDDKCLEGEYLICSFGNGRYIGGGIPITPLANVQDGVFEVLVVDAVPRWKIPFYLPALMTGKLYTKKIAHRYQASWGSIEMPGMRINLDGEILPIEKAVFTCSSNSLKLHF